MTFTLADRIFADAGELCADEGHLDAAVCELAERLEPIDIVDAVLRCLPLQAELHRTLNERARREGRWLRRWNRHLGRQR